MFANSYSKESQGKKKKDRKAAKPQPHCRILSFYSFNTAWITEAETFMKLFNPHRKALALSIKNQSCLISFKCLQELTADVKEAYLWLSF